MHWNKMRGFRKLSLNLENNKIRKEGLNEMIEKIDELEIEV